MSKTKKELQKEISDIMRTHARYVEYCEINGDYEIADRYRFAIEELCYIRDVVLERGLDD